MGKKKRRKHKMAKLIRITDEQLGELRQAVEEAKSMKMSDGKFNFTKTFSFDDRKAVVYFTGEAWAKMSMLIKEFDKEVAWHGVAHRADNAEEDGYVISDIVVYPQEVSGSTVEMDTEKYAEWLMDNVEDERFNNLHMQGHSHVNMGVTPSSVDLNHQEEILNMLGDDDFYIFMIWNKSFTSNVKVYDLQKNVLFENGDVTVKLIGAVDDLDEFLADAKEKVKTKGYAPSTTYGGYPHNKPAGTPYNPMAQGTTQNKDDESGKEEKQRTRIGAGWAGKNACQQSLWDDEDYPYGGYPYY